MASSSIPVVLGYPVMTTAIALISPSSLRIGPDKHQYDYTVSPGFSIAGRPVYRCCRGRDSSLATLYLYFKESYGAWVSESFHVEVTDVNAIERGGAPAFRSLGTVVLREDWHGWQRYDHRPGDWSSPISVWTKPLLVA